MKRSFLRGASAACLAVGSTLWLSPASAHAVCGDRIFPATLAIDDPGVGDELALPNINVQNSSDNGTQASFNFAYSKTIFPDFALSISGGSLWQQGGDWGSPPLVTEAKWKLLCWGEHEFMASVGFQQTWGFSGTGIGQDLFNTYTPILDVGKGFGDLPKSLNVLRPLAVTAAFSENFISDPTQAPNMFNLGFTLQYSLPYYNEHVAEISNPFFKHVVPIVEANFQWPTANVQPGAYSGVTGTVQPGFVYQADAYQFALEAIVPINTQSGTNVGVVGELHFFLDDLFPTSLGKPLFGGKS